MRSLTASAKRRNPFFTTWAFTPSPTKKLRPLALPIHARHQIRPSGLRDLEKRSDTAPKNRNVVHVLRSELIIVYGISYILFIRLKASP